MILNAAISEYIDSALPVGSKLLAEKYGLDVSSSTIRNELNELESDGYLTHVHSSSGRVPTDDGYRFYVDALMEPESLDEAEQHPFHYITVTMTPDRKRVVANGMSRLFKLPEFRDVELILKIVAAIEEQTLILNLLSHYRDCCSVVIAPDDLCECSMVISPYSVDNETVGVLGPKRMRYSAVVPMVQHRRIPH